MCPVGGTGALIVPRFSCPREFLVIVDKCSISARFSFIQSRIPLCHVSGVVLNVLLFGFQFMLTLSCERIVDRGIFLTGS